MTARPWKFVAPVITAIAFVVLAGQIRSTRAQAPTQPVGAQWVSFRAGYMHARDFLNLDPNQQQMFGVGFIDGMFVATVLATPAAGPDITHLSTCITGMKSDQIAAIIDKGIRNLPESWNNPLNAAAYNALLQVCPKEK